MENVLLDKLEKLLEGLLASLKARKEIVPIKAELEELRKENSTLKYELDAANTTVKNLRGDVKEISAERDNWKRQCASVERKLRAEYEDRLSDADKKFNDAQENFNRQLADANAKNYRLQNQLDEANRTANFYIESYSELDKIYNLYLTLDEDTRINLAGIFGAGDTATGFLSGAVQDSHLESLWNYISRNNSDTLQKIFDFAFAAHNMGFRDAPYTRLDVVRGDSFDDEFMSRTPNSSQFGNVSCVLFQGYKYANGSVVKPSIVELA